MKKYIVLSVNANQDYAYYTQLTVSKWSMLGWMSIIFFNGKETPITKLAFNELEGFVYYVEDIPGYRSDTITQISRLYAACVVDPDDLIMTADIDMIPLSYYWKPNPDELTIYGHDLTDYTDFPICYISMRGHVWREVMALNTCDYDQMIKRDLNSLPQAKSTDFYTYWPTDQNHITNRINASGIKKTIINRGKLPNGYAIGRVDRGAWSMDHKQFIDCHMHRDLFKAFYPNPDPVHTMKWRQHYSMLEALFPNENWGWLVEYTNEYAKLAYGK